MEFPVIAAQSRWRSPAIWWLEVVSDLAVLIRGKKGVTQTAGMQVQITLKLASMELHCTTEL